MAYKYNKSKWKKEKEKTMEELFDKIKKGVRDVYKSENWENHLKTISKFHKYSMRNIILIASQKPEATLVAGYKKWQTEFERNVKKGEKGIKILMPVMVKTGNKIEIKKENGEKEVQDEKFLRFKYTSVFDLSQTEGKELDIFKINDLDKNIERKNLFLNSIKNIANENNCEIVFEDIKGDSKGYYHIGENRIAIKKGMSDLQMIKTAVHELAHSRIHNPKIQKETSLDEQQRDFKEIQAESIAYVVLENYKLDTSEYSFPYIATWSQNRSDEELENVLNTIKDSSQEIIEKIDKQFELEKNKTIDLEPKSLEELIKGADEQLKDINKLEKYTNKNHIKEEEKTR